MEQELEKLHVLAPPPRGRRYPMTAMPNGWYFVLRSDELRREQVLPLRYFGRELVTFRGEGGAVSVLDAFCPHLGAHLGHGGTVARDELVCPYHRWQFARDGRCTKVPGSSRVPRAGVRPWPVVEQDGLIFVYYHAAGEPPDFEIPLLEEYASDAWSKYEELELTGPGHVLELQENLVDEAHFVTIHGLQQPVRWTFEPKGRCAVASARTRVGVEGLGLTFDMQANFYGPGVLAIRARGPTDFNVLALGTPIDDEHARYRLLFMTKKPKYAPFLGPVMNRVFRMYARGDFLKEARIWERRRYPTRPVYSSTDATIPKFRSWYRQFWSETGETAGDTA